MIIKLMPSVNIIRAVDTMEITPILVYGTIIGASIWILIFCLLWVIYSRFEESMNSSDPFVFVNAVEVESGRSSRQDV